MKGVIVVLMLVGLALGCGCMMQLGIPNAGVTPGAIVANNTYPYSHEPFTKVQYAGTDMDVLGPVASASSSSCVLGMVSRGDNGYGALLRAARAKYADADAVINIQWDTHYQSYVFGVYTRVESQLNGMAIRYKRSK
jgi:hypothetical protein